MIEDIFCGGVGWNRPNRPTIDYIKHFRLSWWLPYESTTKNWSVVVKYSQINAVNHFQTSSRLYISEIRFKTCFTHLENELFHSNWKWSLNPIDLNPNRNSEQKISSIWMIYKTIFSAYKYKDSISSFLKIKISHTKKNLKWCWVEQLGKSVAESGVLGYWKTPFIKNRIK